ncbi:hypothetical protein K439DRAFT_1630001 [Ramaria rubella]|nr:hypothetical protein K439DRAFT_1630001 [Ramaria rubella]
MSDAHHGKSRISRLPAEILDIIASDIVGFPDLLSFGLTSKALALAIFPRHIQYHTVCASVRHVQTWQHLVRNRSCAANIRHLEIKEDSCDPSSLSGPVHFEPDPLLDHIEYPASLQSQLKMDIWREELVILALHGMTNLRSFAWLRDCPPIVTGTKGIWHALRDKENLVNVKLNEMWHLAPRYARTEHGLLTIYPLLLSPLSTTFSNLVTFDLRCSPGRAQSILNPKMTFTPVIDLLVSCHDLQDISIVMEEASSLDHHRTVDDLFVRGRWPKLRSFRLLDVQASEEDTLHTALGSFFAFHDAIVHLVFKFFVAIDHIGIPLAGDIQSHSLPMLSFLAADDWMVNLIMACPCSPPRMLETVGGLVLDEDFWNLSDQLDGINKLSVHAVQILSIQELEDLRLLAAVFPNVETLDLRYVDMEEELWDPHSATKRVMLHAEWAEILCHFPNLRFLHGFAFLVPDAETEKQEIIKWVADLFPKLEIFDSYNLGGTIELYRGSDGPTWRIIDVRPSPFHVLD